MRSDTTRTKRRLVCFEGNLQTVDECDGIHIVWIVNEFVLVSFERSICELAGPKECNVRRPHRQVCKWAWGPQGIAKASQPNKTLPFCPCPLKGREASKLAQIWQSILTKVFFGWHWCFHLIFHVWIACTRSRFHSFCQMALWARCLGSAEIGWQVNSEKQQAQKNTISIKKNCPSLLLWSSWSPAPFVLPLSAPGSYKLKTRIQFNSFHTCSRTLQNRPLSWEFSENRANQRRNPNELMAYWAY